MVVLLSRNHSPFHWLYGIQWMTRAHLQIKFLFQMICTETHLDLYLCYVLLSSSWRQIMWISECLSAKDASTGHWCKIWQHSTGMGGNLTFCMGRISNVKQMQVLWIKSQMEKVSASLLLLWLKKMGTNFNNVICKVTPISSFKTQSEIKVKYLPQKLIRNMNKMDKIKWKY